MARCDKFEEALWEAAGAGGIPPQLAAHLAECASCRAALQALEVAETGFAALREVDAPALKLSLPAHHARRWPAIAFAAAALLLVGTLCLFLLPRGHRANVTTIVHATPPPRQERQLEQAEIGPRAPGCSRSGTQNETPRTPAQPPAAAYPLPHPAGAAPGEARARLTGICTHLRHGGVFFAGRDRTGYPHSGGADCPAVVAALDVYHRLPGRGSPTPGRRSDSHL